MFLAQKVMSGGSDTNRHHLSQGCDFWCGFARLSIVHIYAQLSQKHFKATFKIFSYFNFLGVTSKKTPCTGLKAHKEQKLDLFSLRKYRCTTIRISIYFVILSKGSLQKKNVHFIHLWWIRVLPPPPLSTAIKVSVITLRFFFIHRRAPPPPQWGKRGGYPL